MTRTALSPSSSRARGATARSGDADALPRAGSGEDDAKPLHVDILIEADRWRMVSAIEAVILDCLRAAAREVAAPADALCSVVLTSDAAVCDLNRTWRGKDSPTNVLSFPAAGPRPPGAPVTLGDVVLAFETIEREAREARVPFAHHVAHLAVHGFLHLLGYDHETGEDAEAMEQCERVILSRLAIPDPYGS